MAHRGTKGDRELGKEQSPTADRAVKRADPAKVKAAVQKIRTRDAELLKRLAR